VIYDEAARVSEWLDRRDTGAPGEPPENSAENLENAIGSLRFLNAYDLDEALIGVSLVERYLSSDPAGVYPGMDETTRATYRAKVGELSKKLKTSEAETAKRVLRLASRGMGGKAHVGWWLFDEPLGRKNRRTGARLYLFSLLWASVFVSLGLCAMLGSLWYLPLVALPVVEMVKNLCDFIVLRKVSPTHIPRMGFEQIPDQGRTLCVVSALVASKEKPKRIAGLLEQYHIANRGAGANLSFGLILDLKDAKNEDSPDDGGIIKAAKEEIARLNGEYGPRFFLFHRKRSFNAKDKIWMGIERKRGAIHDLTRLLRGIPSEIQNIGNAELPSGIRYLIALDEDTRLTAGSAVTLVGAMLHPRNRAILTRSGRS
jgi:cyclic beta-1,2-glucan synthetase